MAEVYENKVLISGGVDRAQRKARSSYILDLTSGIHSKVGDLNREGRMPGCILFDNRVYLVEEKKRGNSGTEMFDLEKEIWTEGPSFPDKIEGRPSLAKIKDQLFCSDSKNLYKLNHHKDGIKWELVKLAKGLKSQENIIPLAVLILEIDPKNDNMCKFTTKE